MTEGKVKAPMNKQMKSLLYKAGSLVLLGIFMFTAVFGYLSRSFGWFSDNTEVSASGMSVQSSEGLNVKANFATPNEKGEYVVPGTNDATFAAFSELIPGSKVLLYVKVENFETVPVAVNLSLAPPTTAVDEVPIIIHNESGKVVASTTDGAAYSYYYFGSQLRINSMVLVKGSLYGDSTLVYQQTGQGKYLLPTTSLGYDKNGVKGDIYQVTGLSATGVTAPVTFPTTAMLLTNDFTLPAATEADGTVTPSSVVIKVEVEFVDNRENQNAYIKFGQSIKIDEKTTVTPVCQRKLIFTTVTN